MTPFDPNAQPPAERRAAETHVRSLITKLAPAHARLVAAVRKTLRQRLPAAHEIVYEYRDCVVISLSPNERGYEGVFAVRASAEGVKLYFNRGKELPDPDKLLRGSSGVARFIDVEGASTLARAGVSRLIDEAITRNRVPFEAIGRGSVVIRPTTASKPRKRTPSTRAGGSAQATGKGHSARQRLRPRKKSA